MCTRRRRSHPGEAQYQPSAAQAPGNELARREQPSSRPGAAGRLERSAVELRAAPSSGMSVAALTSPAALVPASTSGASGGGSTVEPAAAGDEPGGGQRCQQAERDGQAAAADPDPGAAPGAGGVVRQGPEEPDAVAPATSVAPPSSPCPVPVPANRPPAPAMGALHALPSTPSHLGAISTYRAWCGAGTGSATLHPVPVRRR